MGRKLSVAILLLVVGLGALGFWYWQKNNFSKDVLNFQILVPSEAPMGQEITYTIRWRNNGSILLENPSLTFEFPQGTIPSVGGPLRVTKALDDIYPGQEKTLELKARLFGAQGDVKEAKAYLTYSPKNLQASYESDTSGTTVISSVPLSFDLDLPSRMESGQPFTFTLNYFSNSDYPLANTRIKIDYPQGFTFQQASPAPIGQNEWSIGILNKGQGGRIVVKGTLQGQLQEAKNFHATFGSWDNGDYTLFKEITRGIEIAQPQIEITQLINSDNPGGVTLGDVLHYEVSFKNVSGKDLQNLFLAIQPDPNFFNFDTLNVQGATLQKSDGSLVWQASSNPQLRFLGQGEEGSVEFWIKTKDTIDLSTQGSQTTNFILSDKVVLSDVSQNFETKINSKIGIDQTAYYQDEVFGNTGPLPPQAGSATTYTIIWKAQNLYNDVQNAKVKAVLPQNVQLTGKIFPEGSSLTFDSQSREIVWTIGGVQAGAGSILAPASVAFQVSFTPSMSQRGAVAQLLGSPHLTADDTWTLQTLSASDRALDTSIPDDASSQGKGIVQ